MFSGKGPGIVSANLIFLGCVVASIVIGFKILHNTSDGDIMLDAHLNTVEITEASLMAETFGGEGKASAEARAAYDAIKDASDGTQEFAGQAAAQAAFKLVLKQRMKTDYQVRQKSVGFLDENGDTTKFPSDSIDFQYKRINKDIQMCIGDPDVESYAQGLSPGYSDKNKDHKPANLNARCAEVGRGNEIKPNSEDPYCTQTWIAQLYSTPHIKEGEDGFRAGAFGIAVDDNHITEACEWGRKHYDVMSGFFIAFVVLQFLSYAYWTYIQANDTNDVDEMHTRIAAGAQLLAWAFAIVLMGFFVAAYSKTIVDANDGLQTATIVSFNDDTEIKDFPGRAKMYEDAFKLCYPGITVVDSDALAELIPAPTKSCMTPANFKATMEALGLDGAGACAFGGAKTTYSNPIDACNLPVTFENYAIAKGGAELTIKDARSETKPSGSDSTITIISFDTDTKGHYIALFVFLSIFIVKSTFVVLELTGLGPTAANALCCFIPQKTRENCFGEDNAYAIGGGYAGAV